MKKSEVAVSSEEEEDEDAVLSLDESCLNSDPDISFELMDGDEMRNDLSFPVPAQSSSIYGDEENSIVYSNVPQAPKELELRDYALWSRTDLAKGKRFGPIPAQLKDTTPPSSAVWKVVDEHGTIKAWVDVLVAPGGQWTAFLRVSERVECRNVCPVFVGGQIYLEVIQHIEAGRELSLSTYDLLLPHETSYRNGNSKTTLDDRENGECTSYASPSNPQVNSQPPPPLVPILNHQEDGDTSTKDGPARCLTCDLDFPDHFRLNEHIGNSHFSEDSGQGEREYKCPQCPKVFNWKSNLIRHQVAHDDSRRYVCENCKKVFTDPSNLQRHIRSQHIGARSHACAECGKTFATSSGLKQHTHIHSSVKPFRCEVCLKAYTQFSNLCRHKRMHATCRMQIKCHKCGQAFSAVTSLSKHKRFCEGTGNSTSSTSSAHSQSTNQVSTFESGKIAPMSLAPPPTNSLLFYPRPGFPLYPPSLFAYPIFSGPGLPAPPPLIPDTGLLTGQNSNAAATAITQAAQDLQRQLFNSANASVTATASKQELSSPVKSDKRQSEASESEASDELSSDSAGEDISSISDGESETETLKSPPTTPRSSKTCAPSNGESETMFSNHRQGSPKQGSVCPDPSMILSPMSANGPLRAAMSNGLLKASHDMPFDLSQANKIRIQDEASGFHRKVEKPEEQPLDLSVSRKKTYPNIEEEKAKALLYFREKEQHFSPGNASITPVLPAPVHQLELPKPQSPIPQSPTKLHMAYPRPIHPMFLESMYRLQQEKPAFNLFPTPDRLMTPFPPRYPFLGPLLGTTPSFDFMRAHMEKVGKPMHEIMSPHLGKAKERYSCKFCGKIFPRSANLTRHLRTHTGEQPYKCKYCERSFSISSNLQRHVRNIHNKEKPFKCPLCDRCFGQQTNLDRHLKKHEADGPTILDDSPKTIEVDDKDETYFDEIRNFIGKVTNNSHLGGHPGAPISLMTPHDDRKRDHLMLMNSLRQHSPGSGHSENLDDETDGISPSDQEDEPMLKKHRSSGSQPASSPSGDSNRSPDYTKGNNSQNGQLRNGNLKLTNHQKALAYEMMMSLNRKLEIANGSQENLKKNETDGEDEDDDERKESSDDEIDPVKDEDDDLKPQKKKKKVDVE